MVRLLGWHDAELMCGSPSDTYEACSCADMQSPASPHLCKITLKGGKITRHLTCTLGTNCWMYNSYAPELIYRELGEAFPWRLLSTS